METGAGENRSGPAGPGSPAPVILYDGDCGLCDRVVQWVLPRDRAGKFRFAALQSAWGQAALRRLGRPTIEFDTIMLIEGGRVSERSTAALRILRGLPRWRWAYALIVVPRCWRDGVYNAIARRRKRWFPAPAACGLPKPGWRERFITSHDDD